MPTFKHPCPYCDKLIDKVVAACPFCGRVDPFAPKRCLNCRKIIEDPAWVVCPSCGASLTMVVTTAPGTGAGTTTGGAAGQAAPPQPPANPTAAAPQAPAPGQPAASVPPAPAGKCSGCGAPLPAGARFCTICGTVAG
jgi:RNA polymerase subunit RPABC4/transcription elongation factor Spt4